MANLRLSLCGLFVSIVFFEWVRKCLHLSLAALLDFYFVSSVQQSQFRLMAKIYKCLTWPVLKLLSVKNLQETID